MSLTAIEYQRLEDAYRFFNERLFGGALPDLLITYRAGKNVHGYFSANRLASTQENVGGTHELALSLSSNDRPAKEVLATLVHEMTHVLREDTGSYHTKAWAALMESVGLSPYNIEQPEIQTGRKVSHTIVPGGPFDLAADELLAQGWQQSLYEPAGVTEARAKRQAQQRKVKYTCSQCDLKVWGRANLNLICADCSDFTGGDLVYLLEA